MAIDSFNDSNDKDFDKIMSSYINQQQDSLSWPDEKVVLRYLSKEASEKEIEQIQDAMIESAKFMELIINYQAVGSKLNTITNDEHSELSIPKMPLVYSALAREEPLKTDMQQISYNEKIIKFSTKYILPIAVAAVIAIFFIPKYFLIEDPKEIVFSKYDVMLQSAFEINPHMGVKESDIFYNSQDAAYSVFLSSLKLEDEKWLLVNENIDNSSNFFSKNILLNFKNYQDELEKRVNFHLPNNVWNRTNKQMEIWFLSVPSLIVSKAKLMDDNLATTLPNKETDSLYFITITYESDSLWQVLPVSVIHLNK